MPEDFANLEASARSGENVTFSFGRNWEKYVRSLTEDRRQAAQESLRASFSGETIAGQSVLDIGCGSGVFSLGFYSLDARQVTSIDVDPHSVACAAALRSQVDEPHRWNVRRGSILDDAFVASLDPAEIVYAWGVLHHTGDMWAAVKHTMSLVVPGGLLCIALYTRPNRVELHMALKRSYNRLPRLLRPAAVGLYAAAWLANRARRGSNPISFVRRYGENSRGMSFWRDVEDWLGGLPCEFASADEVRQFAEHNGFSVEREVEGTPGGNGEYLLRRDA